LSPRRRHWATLSPTGRAGVSWVARGACIMTIDHIGFNVANVAKVGRMPA
jgi:hypothetical protein